MKLLALCQTALSMMTIMVFSGKCFPGEFERDTLALLKKDEYWSKPEHKDDLLAAIANVRKHRILEATSILVARITYRPSKGLITFSSSIAIGDIYPVYGCLLDFGLVSGEPILKELRLSEPESNKARLLVSCLLRIYSVGGHGKEMTRRRLELEKAATSGSERIRIERALADALLN